jgi:hypothetical protein
MPTIGRQAKVYSILSLSQRMFGMGRAEYIEKVTIKE